MIDAIGYKIESAEMIPYQIAIDRRKMKELERANHIVASSRIYLICKIRQTGTVAGDTHKPEVLFVGETFGKTRRFKGHDRLPGTDVLGDNAYLFVYFLVIRSSIVGSTSFRDNPMVFFNEVKNMYGKTSVWLLKTLFVKLFCPVLNGEVNIIKVREGALVREGLIKNNIRNVILDIGMNDYLTDFTGGNRIEREHIFTLNLLADSLVPGRPMLGKLA